MCQQLLGIQQRSWRRRAWNRVFRPHIYFTSTVYRSFVPLLFLIFIVVPLVEMFVLIKVGSVIGAVPTIALVCLTAAVGIALIRHQGLSTLVKAQQKMQSGQLPAQEMLDGICLAMGGAMLLTPGFVTDSFGFALLIPGIRHHLFKGLAMRIVPQASTTQFKSAETSRNTIDGEFKRED